MQIHLIFLLVIEMQTKTTIKYNYTPTRLINI